MDGTASRDAAIAEYDIYRVYDASSRADGAKRCAAEIYDSRGDDDILLIQLVGLHDTYAGYGGVEFFLDIDLAGIWYGASFCADKYDVVVDA